MRDHFDRAEPFQPVSRRLSELRPAEPADLDGALLHLRQLRAALAGRAPRRPRTAGDVLSGCDRVTPMLVVAGVLAAVAVIITASRVWAKRDESLGGVSQQWLAEYRASHPSG